MTYTRALKLAVTPLDPLPAFISFSDADGTFNVAINNPADTGVYPLRVVAVEPVSGLLNEDVNFVLTLTCTIHRFYNTAKGVSNKVYEVYPGENPVLKLSKPLYATEPDYCLLRPYSLLITREPEGLEIPSFINIQESNVSI